MFWKITNGTSIPDCHSAVTTVVKPFLPKKDMLTIWKFLASTKIIVNVVNLSVKSAINLVRRNKLYGTMTELCIRENATIARNVAKNSVTVQYWRIIYSQCIKGFPINVKFARRRLRKKVGLHFIWRNYIHSIAQMNFKLLTTQHIVAYNIKVLNQLFINDFVIRINSYFCL